MTQTQVKSFLRFVTGSSVCSVQALEIQFNTLSGLARGPIAHTCSNILELSSTYMSFHDFEQESRLMLSDEKYSWIMDAI